MRVCVIGNAGREHAFAWKLSQSKIIEKIYILPGNAGASLENKCEAVAIDVLDNKNIVKFCLENNIDFVIIGPEAPLANALVDELVQHNIACIGPSQEAAQLESSKTFCKNFLKEHHIPTASFASFKNAADAIAYAQEQSFPLVIKADGIAAGKGVTIANDIQEAITAIKLNLTNKAFGQASNTIVIEEFLYGEEASFIVLCDGISYLPLATSQDHKARDDGDKGPNTGGMGAYSPAPVITPKCYDHIITSIIEPTFAALKQQNIDFRGFLYAGLMIDKRTETAKVLEFNTRCGDPETEVILLRLLSDFGIVCQATIEQRLNTIKLEWDPRIALGVVMCSGGYPETYQTGKTITGLNQSLPYEGKVFHASTKLQDASTVLTHGGRVLCVTAFGDSIEAAQHHAYQNVKGIAWPNVYYRNDIGYRAL